MMEIQSILSIIHYLSLPIDLTNDLNSNLEGHKWKKYICINENIGGFKEYFHGIFDIVHKIIFKH